MFILEIPTQDYHCLCSSVLNLFPDDFSTLENQDDIHKGYTYLCFNPIGYIKVEDGSVEASLPNYFKNTQPEDVISYISKVINLTGKIHSKTTQIPFTGGFVGHISFDFIKYHEPSLMGKLNSMEDRERTPDFFMHLYDTILAYDQTAEKTYLIWHNEFRNNDDLQDKILAMKHEKLTPMDENKGLLRPNLDLADTSKKVEHMKNAIYRGDISQGVPSAKLRVSSKKSPLSVYESIKKVNPTPYMFYADFGDYSLIGSSPESIFNYDGSEIETRALAGTRKRGKTGEEDAKMEADLLGDAKEIAEHNMLVDLARNDIGRSSKPNSVYVRDYMTIEKYSNVMHIVSKIRGQKAEETDLFTAFLNIFPAGTVSGAPKIRAIELISEIEDEKRGFYAGAFGFFGYNGLCDLCITIRTMMYKKASQEYILQVGAGVVKDSKPELEHKEFINKLSGIFTCINDNHK